MYLNLGPSLPCIFPEMNYYLPGPESFSMEWDSLVQEKVSLWYRNESQWYRNQFIYGMGMSLSVTGVSFSMSLSGTGVSFSMVWE